MSRKLSIEKVREEFSSAGLKLCTEEYKTVNDLLPFVCKRGHNHKISLTALRSGTRCTHCAGNKKLTLEYIRDEFSKCGYVLLENEYKNNKQLLNFRCSKGHEHQISYGKFRSGRRCTYCSQLKNKKSRVTLEAARKEFLDAGYTPLFDEYTGVKVPLLFKCDKGHEHRIRLKDLRRGSRCSFCVGGVGSNLEDAQKEFSRVGYSLLETAYKNNRLIMSYLCDKGHQHKMSLSNLKKGNKCPDCSFYETKEKLKLPLDEVYKKFTDLGYTPLFTEYDGAHKKVPFRCNKGHYHEIMPYTLDNGVRCRKCSNSGVSRAEKEISNYFKELGIVFLENDRKLIGPLEVDIYFPEQKIAVEFCGLYWHSELAGKKSRKYHYSKMIKCRNKGVRLITVFEDEYCERPEVVLSRIVNSLGLCKDRLYARNCYTKIIDGSVADEFLVKHHLQGTTFSKVAFGLFYDEELVGVMTGGSLSRNHFSKKTILELKRLCFLPGYVVVGGASKLFKCLVNYAKELGFTTIRSYQDMRYGSPFGSVYTKLGFRLVTESKYTPHYVKGNKRFRNQRLMKTSEERKTGKTEWELRREQGFDRIWDCGHRTYVYDIINNLSVG
jgi:hypothetical protein